MKCSVCGSVNGKIVRTNQQNRYYWPVIVGMLSEHTGFTPEEMHEILKYKFLPKSMKKGFIIPGRTSTLTTTEFEQYLTEIKEWAAIELGVVLPDPNETN